MEEKTQSLLHRPEFLPALKQFSNSISKFDSDGIKTLSALAFQPNVQQNDRPLTASNARQWIADRQTLNSTSTDTTEGVDPLTGLSKDAAIATSTESDSASTDPLMPRMSALVASGLPYPGYPLKYQSGKSLKYDIHVEQWQQRMKDRGWKITVDGFYGPNSSQIARQFQREKGLRVDGIVGPRTWKEAFRADNVTVGPVPEQPYNPPSSLPGSPGGTGGINREGLALIKNFEGFRAKAYRDPVGVWTIGYGHTGADVRPGDVITRAEGETLLKRDLRTFESHVRKLVKVPLTSNQFSALVSFTYNVGPGSLADSTLLRLLNQRNYQGAADQLPRWNRAGGKVFAGLVRRRSAERALFLKPDARMV